MNQTRLGSLIEAFVNVAIGYGVSLAGQVILFPLYGIEIAISTNVQLGLWFTVISIVRSYLLRRYFNARLHAAADKVAKMYES